MPRKSPLLELVEKYSERESEESESTNTKRQIKGLDQWHALTYPSRLKSTALMQIYGKCTESQIGPISNGYVTHLVCILSTPPVKDITRNRPCPKNQGQCLKVCIIRLRVNYSCNYEAKLWLKNAAFKHLNNKTIMVAIFLRSTHL